LIGWRWPSLPRLALTQQAKPEVERLAGAPVPADEEAGVEDLDLERRAEREFNARPICV